MINAARAKILCNLYLQTAPIIRINEQIEKTACEGKSEVVLPLDCLQSEAEKICEKLHNFGFKAYYSCRHKDTPSSIYISWWE